MQHVVNAKQKQAKNSKCVSCLKMIVVLFASVSFVIPYVYQQDDTTLPMGHYYNFGLCFFSGVVLVVLVNCWHVTATCT